MSSQVRNLLLYSLLLAITQCLFSKYSGRCRLHNPSRTSYHLFAIQKLHPQKCSYSPEHSQPTFNPYRPLLYTDPVQFYYLSALGKGGSGEVFLVEDYLTGQLRVIKRYDLTFHTPTSYQQENYIMHKAGVDVQWAEQCVGQKQCRKLSIFPYRHSITLEQMQYDPFQAPLIFYKMLEQLERIHSLGIIHRDIKPDNILINPKESTLGSYSVEIIDWNIALPYHSGYEQNATYGTRCFQPLQVVIGSKHPTPAIDIFALAITMYFHYTNSVPYKKSCHRSPLQALISLGGGPKVAEFYTKNKQIRPSVLHLIEEIDMSPEKYPSINLSTHKPDIDGQPLEQDFVDVLERMLEPDPQNRATATELKQMAYFDKLKSLPKFGQNRRKSTQE